MLRNLIKAIVPRKCRPGLARCKAGLMGLFYVGRKRFCPCCGGHFRKFLSQGTHARPDARCPRCNSLERHRLLWLYFAEKKDLFSDRPRVLHVAPEPSLQRKLASLGNLEYVSADLDSPLAKIRMDITSIPFPENSFDVILCNHVLEHVPDDRKAMRELFRVLKPGGWAILQSPVDLTEERTVEDVHATPEERERRFGQRDHVRRYGKDYQERLEEAGFKAELDDFAAHLDPEQITKMALMADEIVYFCTIPVGKGLCRERHG